MYIALGLMFCGIFTGWLFRRFLSVSLLNQILFGSVLALLLLLGIQVGANELLFANLDTMGLQAMVLTLLALAGSVLAVRIMEKLANLPKKTH